MSKNGIDISNWQAGINLAAVPCDFVIIKSSEGVSYISPSFESQYNQAKSLNKMVGIYHFASGRQTGTAEADYFLGVIGDKYKDAFLVLDWEEYAITVGVDYAKEFLDRVKKVTGKKALIYMSAGVTRAYDWSSVAKTYPLWVAQYGSDDLTGYQSDPWNDGLGYGAWVAPHIFQYSSHGRLPGYGANLDINIMYKEPDAKSNACKGKTKVTHKVLTKKQMQKLVDEVIAGKWGNGDERVKKLEAKGYDSTAIQRQVNKKLKSIKKEKKSFKVGDTVKFTGKIQYKSSDKKSTGYGCKGGKAKIKAIKAGAAHPYKLKAVAGKGSTVNGWVNKADIKAYKKKKSTYTVKAGDTLSDIAAAYGTTVEKLVQLNAIANKDIIYAGQVIKLN